MEQLPALGLDVGKQSVHVAFLREGAKDTCEIPNDASGFQQLLAWLRARNAERVHACLEASGGWSEQLAIVLVDAGHVVSIVNPMRIKAFGKTELLRTKTDRVDAMLIARFCALHRPAAWSPPSTQHRILQSLTRHLEDLIELRGQAKVRSEGPACSAPVRASFEHIITTYDKEIADTERQIRELINEDSSLRSKRESIASIPGIGNRTAERILGEMPKLDEFHNAKAVAAYAGLSPREYQSGAHRGRTRISKVGNRRLRKALWWPAIVAMRCNATIRAFAERLLAAGKPRMVVIVAVMRKLLCYAYAIVRSGNVAVA